MIRVDKDQINLDDYVEVKISQLPRHQQDNPKYLPTHFFLQLQEQGEYQGYQKVTYLKKKQK